MLASAGLVSVAQAGLAQLLPRGGVREGRVGWIEGCVAGAGDQAGSRGGQREPGTDRESGK